MNKGQVHGGEPSGLGRSRTPPMLIHNQTLTNIKAFGFSQLWESLLYVF